MRVIRTDLARPLLAGVIAGKEGWRDYDRNQDLVFVAGEPERVQASVILRPTMLVRQFAVNPGLPATMRVTLARSLMGYVQGYALDRPIVTSGFLFQVEAGNGTMRAFAETLGGKAKDDTTLYIVEHA